MALIFLLIFTCPSADEHKRVLSDVVTSTINDVTTSAVNDSTDELTSKTLQTFNDVFTKRIISGAMDNLVSVDNILCWFGRKNKYCWKKLYCFGGRTQPHIYTK